jgi:hypothetical protein
LRRASTIASYLHKFGEVELADEIDAATKRPVATSQSERSREAHSKALLRTPEIDFLINGDHDGSLVCGRKRDQSLGYQ